MTAAKGHRQDELDPAQLRQRRRVRRPLFSAGFWAVVALASWAVFRLSLIRMQPDAIATGGPGFFVRLVVRPLEWAMNTVVTTDPLLTTLQAVTLVTICIATARWPELSRTPVERNNTRLYGDR